MSNHLPTLRAPRWFVSTLYGTAFVGGILMLAALGDAGADFLISVTR